MSGSVPEPLRRWVSPLPGDSWESMAARVLPEMAGDKAVAALQSWNLHLAFRPPPAVITCSDILFIEPPKT